eukprot:gene10283-biopygen8617
MRCRPCCAHEAIIHPVKLARPPLVQVPKGRTGGTSGLHRTAQELTTLHRERCEAQIWSVVAGCLAAGTSVILDIGLMRRADRDRVREIAAATELPLQFHFVTASAEARRARVAERNVVKGENFAIE